MCYSCCSDLLCHHSSDRNGRRCRGCIIGYNLYPLLYNHGLVNLHYFNITLGALLLFIASYNSI